VAKKSAKKLTAEQWAEIKARSDATLAKLQERIDYHRLPTKRLAPHNLQLGDENGQYGHERRNERDGRDRPHHAGQPGNSRASHQVAEASSPGHRPGTPVGDRERAVGGRGRHVCQRTQLMLAPLERTRAARLAMARKILFDMCAPPIEVVSSQPPPL
jgi:hypothetical protein